MHRPKRIQFWGEDENDDSLVVEIIEGKKTATVSKADEFYESDGEFDDGGLEVGDIVDVYDLKPRLRCRIRITEVYPVRFGDIPEKLWKGEACRSAEHFQAAHRYCWPDCDLNDDFEMMAMHFELVEVVHTMQLIQAHLDHLDEVTELIQRVTEALTAQGIVQWDERYPNRAFILEAITDGNLYVFVVDGVIVGSVVLDEWQAPEWDAIPWQPTTLPVLVIHALAIAPRFQGRGYGAALLRACEQLVAEHGYGCLRLDVFEGNPAARHLYERHGYRYCGQIQYHSKPVGHQAYACYEKMLA